MTIENQEFDGDSQVSSAHWFLNDSVVRGPHFPLQIPICLHNTFRQQYSSFYHIRPASATLFPHSGRGGVKLNFGIAFSSLPVYNSTGFRSCVTLFYRATQWNKTPFKIIELKKYPQCVWYRAFFGSWNTICTERIARPENPLRRWHFFFLTSPLLWSKIAFDHMFDHFGKIPSISYPGVAQLVGRLVWELEHQTGSRIPLTRKPVAALVLFLLDFSPALV